jgi:predicted membrane channel-forming protein YqfA (hemolysin III family)
MTIIIRTTTLSYPDWLPAAGLALLVLIALLSIAGTFQRRAPKSRAVNVMIGIVVVLAYAGVFAMLRMVL